LKRGDIVTVAMPGDYGKRRPALVIQADALTAADTDTVLVCLMTSEIRDAAIRRITVRPDPDNKLNKTSQIMIEKIFAARRDKCRKRLGTVNDETLASVDAALMFVCGLIDA
jgi:mRNA interferase MazF